MTQTGGDFYEPGVGWRGLGFTGGVALNPTTDPFEHVPEKPICVGLTCWLWQRPERAVAQLAARVGVTLRVTQQIHGLRREIECQVSGKNVDRFIGEFVRHC